MKKIFTMLAMLLSIFPLTLLAEQKIGVVKMQDLFENYYKTKIEDAKIKQQTEVYKKYLLSLNDARDRLQKEYSTLRDAAQSIAYSDAERENSKIEAQNKYRELQAKEAEIQQYNAEKKKLLFDEYDKARKDIINEITKVVESYGEREDFTLIFDSSGNTFNTIPAVVYNNKSLDITSDVLKELNMGNKITDKK